MNYQSGEGCAIVPRNCLHSIVRILNKLLQDSSAIYSLSNSIDMSYEIIYTLCTNPLYNQELLGYLRTEYDFIYKHLKLTPLMESDKNEANEQDMKICVYSQNCWVMNMACIEMQSLTASKQKMELKKLIELLIENTELNQKPTKKANASTLASKSTFLNQSTFLNSTNFEDSKFGLFNTINSEKTANESKITKNNYNNKIFDILLMLSFSQDSSEPLNLSYFEPNLIEKVIDTYKTKPDFVNMKLYDLHKVVFQ